MAMRMIIQAPGMGMKNRCHTDVGTQISRIEAKVFQGTGSTIEQDVVNSGLVTPSERAKFIGQGKRHHKIFDRQKFGELTVQPF